MCRPRTKRKYRSLEIERAKSEKPERREHRKRPPSTPEAPMIIEAPRPLLARPAVLAPVEVINAAAEAAMVRLLVETLRAA